MSSNATRIPCTPAGADSFRRTCARFATGIAVVTALDRAGSPHGMTANSFTSVSLEPPLVLICIDNRAAILKHLLAAEAIGINILTEGQSALSVRFARPGEDRFGAVEWYAGEMGVPLIPDALAVFECVVRQFVEAGDHQVLIAEARYVGWREERPLVYWNSGYGVLE
jgi:flavin reductase (DIM6/NTAB) family NADH-FMN oxidoreductase RutF